MIDAKAFGQEISAMVRGHVEKAIAPLREENASLRTENKALADRLLVIEKQPPDLSGVEASVSELRALIEGIEIPEAPELPDIAGLINDAVSETVAALPTPADGKDGKDADPAELDAVKRDLAVLNERLKAIKIPEAIAGKDGAAVASASINADGELICKLTNGETLNAGHVVGRDGLGLEDLTLDFDGERTVTLRLQSGEVVKEKSIRFPIPIDRGVYKDETDYERGDVVSWAGSAWIAQKDAPEGKPEQSKDWRLSVKRGRDGKPAVKP